MKKRIRFITILFAGFVLCFLSTSGFVECLAKAVEGGDTNSYGIEAEMDSVYHYYTENGEILDTASVTVKCPDEWKDKIQYQWMIERPTQSGYYEITEVENETESSFTPSLSMLADNTIVCCNITLEGNNDFLLTPGYAFYLKLSGLCDLTKEAYTDDMILPSDSYRYMYRIQGAEQTKALRIHWLPQDNIFAFSIQDAEGNRYNLEEETEIELKGNYCNVMVYYMGQCEGIGIQSVEQQAEFTKKVYCLTVENGSEEPEPGELLDLSKISVYRQYNDGTWEAVPAGSFICDNSRPLQYGENEFEVIDNETKLSCRFVVYVVFQVKWKVRPAEVFTSSEIQKASVELPEIKGGARCLWMLRNINGDIAADIENDMEPEIQLPQNLPAGTYELYCYYYTKETGFQEDEYLMTSFRVKSGGTSATAEPTVSPEPTKTPEATDLPVPTVEPTASPKPANQVKKPGRVAVTVKIKKKTLAITMKINSDVSGYQIMYARDKKFTKGKHAIHTKKKIYKLKGIKKKKIRYIRVRAFRKGENGKNKYGKWSRIKHIK